jgi:hypothetical protein
MPATVTQVATGLATNLSTITGLRTSSYQPEQLNTPLAFPTLNTVTFHKAMGGGDVTMDWTITVLVGRYTDRTAFATLDGYLSYSGATSVRAAIESDKTLGGVCQTLVVSSAADISSVNAGDAEFLQIQFTVQVHG